MGSKGGSSKGGGGKDNGRYRSSISGRYVTDRYGEKNPKTTEYEKGPKKPPPKK